ncbi:hypothetical protein ACOMHN_007193 [Nucella lapillus]
MASSTAVVSGEDSPLCPPPALPFRLKDIQQIIDAQTAVFNEKFASIFTVISTIKISMQNISCDVAELKQQTVAVEDSCEEVKGKQDELRATVEDLEEDITEIKKEINKELDILESVSRRDNLKFFNIPESPDENYESCADEVVNVLQNTVPNKEWALNDVRAHRIGTRTTSSISNPRPMIVKMSRWKDKMDIINSGREALKKKGIKVASDLTTRQRAVLKDHRDRGLHAYYKAGKLIVTGPLRTCENWSNSWQHSEEAQKHKSVSSKKSGHRRSFPHPSDVADIGPSTLLKTSEWPALRTPRGDRPANPPKRPRPHSSPETESMEPDQTAEEWA